MTSIVNLNSNHTKLANPWVMWVQNSGSFQEWEKHIVCCDEFYTIEEFIDKTKNLVFDGRKKFIFMRKGIKPCWEDPKHKTGAYCTAKIKLEMNKNSYLNCVSNIIADRFLETGSLNITGVTCIFGPRSKQIRIWISDKNNAVSIKNVNTMYFTNVMLCDYLIGKEINRINLHNAEMEEKFELIEFDNFNKDK